MSDPRHDRSLDDGAVGGSRDADGGSLDDVDAGEDSRRRRFLRLLNWGWLGTGMLAAVALALNPDQLRLMSVIITTTVATFVIVRVLIGRGHTRAACALFTLLVDLGLFAIFLMLAREIGLERALQTEVPALMMMGLVILFAGALVDPRAPFAIAGLNSALLAILVVRAEARTRVSASTCSGGCSLSSRGSTSARSTTRSRACRKEGSISRTS